MTLPQLNETGVVWTGLNELEVARLVAGDRRVHWREDLHAYAVGDDLAYPGDRIVRTAEGFSVERAGPLWTWPPPWDRPRTRA